MSKERDEIIKRYSGSPALQKEIAEHYKKIDEYMNSDEIPPIHKGQRKSRLDIVDNELRMKMVKYNFIQACSTGDFDEVKAILRRFEKPQKEEIVNSVDEEGHTGLDYACMLCYPQIEAYLLKNGAIETIQTHKIRENQEEIDTKNNSRLNNY